jgi:predicted dehydrogenase
MKIAIVGCGLIGKKRAKSLPGDAVLAGCFDTDLERGASFAREFGTECFQNLDELLRINDLKAVIVATRHDSLAPIGAKVLEHGINLFLEKPGGLNLKELDAITSIAEQRKLHLHIGYNHLFHPALLKVREIAKRQDFGKIMFIRARYGHGGRLGYENEWRADKKLSGGGELIDQGTHLIDIALDLLGDLSVDYAATPNYFWKMHLEDNAFLSLKNSSGSIAFLHASCTEWKNMFSLEVYGEYGKLDVAGLGGSYGTETLTHYTMLPEMGPPNSMQWEFEGEDESWNIELESFIQDINNGTFKSDNSKSSKKVLEIVEEIYERNNR